LNLQWRIEGTDGSMWSPQDAQNLEISVVDQEVEINDKGDKFHNYGPVNAHPELQWGN
jgi:hypothetical protein